MHKQTGRGLRRTQLSVSEEESGLSCANLALTAEGMAAPLVWFR
jgi:hypothetical protein